MHQRRLLVILSALIMSVLIFFFSTTVVPPSVASAHAFVIGSDPVDGSTVTTVPRVVRIYFNAPISAMSNARVYSVQNGDLVDVTAAHSTIAANDPRQLDTLLKTPGQLPQGSYEVRWIAVANDDGHTTNGLIGFNVGVSSTGLPGIPTLGPSTSNNLDDPGGAHVLDFTGILSVAWDWLILLALMLWIGILATEQLIVVGMDRISVLFDQAHKRAVSLHWLCLVALLFGEIVSLVLRASRFSQTQGIPFNASAMLQLLISTNYGSLLIIRIVLLLMALVLLYKVSRPAQVAVLSPVQPQRATRSGPLRQNSTQDFHTGPVKSITKDRIEVEPAQSLSPLAQRYTPLWVLLAGAILFTRALSGNAVQVLQPPMSAVIFDWLYQAALGIWLGGLAYLAYILLPLLAVVDRDHIVESLVTLQRRFTPYQLACMGIVLVSGFFLAEASISAPQQLLSDPYGRTLLTQSILLLLMLLSGGYVLFVLRPRLIRQALLLPVVNAELPARRTRQTALEQTGKMLRRIVSAQTCLGAGVLLCLALMAFFAPPIVFPNITYTNTPAQPTTGTTGAQTQQVGDLSVTLEVLPARVNATNAVIVMINDRNGNPVTNAQVQLSVNMDIMDMGTAHASMNGGSPVYVATFNKGASFSMGGVWDIGVSIQRPHQPALQTRFQVTLPEPTSP